MSRETKFELINDVDVHTYADEDFAGWDWGDIEVPISGMVNEISAAAGNVILQQIAKDAEIYLELSESGEVLIQVRLFEGADTLLVVPLQVALDRRLRADEPDEAAFIRGLEAMIARLKAPGA